jgi:hypothetical protein
MEQISEREESIKKYLLGELADNEQTEVELQLLTDEEFFNELLLVEDEMTDDFVFGALTDHEEKNFIKHFSSIPKQQEKVIFTKALDRYISEYVTLDTSEIVWEETLAEAQENRYLLESLIDNEWLGLRLLALLRTMPQDKITLSENLQLNSKVFVPTVIRLIECGAIEERGDKFFCTKLGIETLTKIEEVAAS